MTDHVTIIYRITLGDGKQEVFNFQLDDQAFDLAGEIPDNPPAWTELGHNQCAHCPLSSEEHSHCPLALQMHNIVSRFHNTRSIDEVALEVITEERHVSQTTALQRVLASMLDLIYPTCGCPKTAYMKPLARFHLPLCSEEETVFRVTGMYMLAQYFLNQTSSRGRIEFSGLTDIYNDMHVLNTSIARRLQSATLSDSAKNAVTLVDMYSTLVPLLLEDQLAEMRGFFRAFLPKDEPVQEVTTNYLEKAKAFSMDLELLPIDDEQTDDELPDWLKQANAEEETAATAPAAEKKPAEAKPDNSPFRTSDGLTLELAPLDEEQPKPAPASGKARFSLPDD